MSRKYTRTDDSDYLTIIIDAFEGGGKKKVSVHNISPVNVEALDPMLIDIKNHGGYYPTKKYVLPNRPSARDLYGMYSAWDMFQALLPSTDEGFVAVGKVRIFTQDPMTMEM